MKRSEFVLSVITVAVTGYLIAEKIRLIKQNNSEIVKDVEAYLRYTRLVAVNVSPEDIANVARIESQWTNESYKWRHIDPKVTSSP